MLLPIGSRGITFFIPPTGNYMRKISFILSIICLSTLNSCKEELMDANFQTERLYSYLPYNTHDSYIFTNGTDTISYSVQQSEYTPIVEVYWPQGTEFSSDPTCPENCTKTVYLTSNNGNSLIVSAMCIGRQKLSLGFLWKSREDHSTHGRYSRTNIDTAKIYEVMTDSIFMEDTHYHALIVREKGLLYYTDDYNLRWTLIEQ